MKNTVYIDYDDDRVGKEVILAKLEEIENVEITRDLKVMLLTDYATLVNSVVYLIDVISENKIADRSQLVNETVRIIYSRLNESKTNIENEQT